MDVRQPIKLLVGGLVIALAGIVSACGAMPAGAGTGNAPSTQGGAAPASTAGAAASPSSGTTGSAQVTLVPNAAHYAVSDTITITVHNTTGQTIYTMAHFTDCSAISLERRVGGNWQPVNLCADGFPHPVIAPISPDGEVATELTAATTPGNEVQSEAPEWTAGTYRAVLTYTTSRSADFSHGAITYSTTFTVG